MHDDEYENRPDTKRCCDPQDRQVIMGIFVSVAKYMTAPLRTQCAIAPAMKKREQDRAACDHARIPAAGKKLPAALKTPLHLDENRLRILLMLKHRSLCVCEIHEVLHSALSTISAHLKLMKNLGLIQDEKDGRWVIYSLSHNAFLFELLHRLEKELQSDSTVQSDRAVISTITREVCASKLRDQ